MGSLTSRPKVPASVSSPSYAASVPASVSPKPVTQTPSSPAVPITTPSADTLQGEARTANLLTRGRGIFGTVLTGFRGMLAQVEGRQRKSLLGE